MARRRKARRKSGRTGTVTRGRVPVRGHTRGPRGPDRGKPRVRVPAYQRRKPR